MMSVDMRVYPGTRDAVHAGMAALRVHGRQIWGDARSPLPDIVVRLMVGVGDLARIARDSNALRFKEPTMPLRRELQKELGNIIFSTIRWIDDLGLDVLECLDLAIETQEKFAQSGRLR